jgi:hypothetical protein
MTTAGLLDSLRTNGATIALTRGGRLRIVAPPGIVSDDILTTIRERKPELVRLIRDNDRTLYADAWAYWFEFFVERASIREYDGGQTREHAEAEALAETLAGIRAQGVYPPGEF